MKISVAVESLARDDGETKEKHLKLVDGETLQIPRLL
jgi:hypothetical protein